MNQLDTEELLYIVSAMPKTRDGKPLIEGRIYYTKNGLQCKVRVIPIFDVSTNDVDGVWRPTTAADVFSEPQPEKFYY